MTSRHPISTSFRGLTGCQRDPRGYGCHIISGQGTTDCDANFIHGDDAMPLTHLDVFDFFEDPSGKINHFIGNGNV